MMPLGRFQRLFSISRFAVHVKELGTFLVCLRGCWGWGRSGDRYPPDRLDCRCACRCRPALVPAVWPDR